MCTCVFWFQLCSCNNHFFFSVWTEISKHQNALLVSDMQKIPTTVTNYVVTLPTESKPDKKLGVSKLWSSWLVWSKATYWNQLKQLPLNCCVYHSSHQHGRPHVAAGDAHVSSAHPLASFCCPTPSAPLPVHFGCCRGRWRCRTPVAGSASTWRWSANFTALQWWTSLGG